MNRFIFIVIVIMSVLWMHETSDADALALELMQEQKDIITTLQKVGIADTTDKMIHCV